MTKNKRKKNRESFLKTCKNEDKKLKAKENKRLKLIKRSSTK